MTGERVKHMARVNTSIAPEEDLGKGLSRHVCKGVTLYRTFKRVEPSHVVRVHHPRLIPSVVVELGDLVGLMYRSDKWQAGQPRTYVHFMQDPPRLVSNVEGKQLFIVGGNYRVTPQGIEG